MKLRLIDIELLLFLLSAPVFNSYLLVFQWERSLILIIHEQMTELVTLMRRFVKESIINNFVKTKDLLAINATV